MSIYQDEKNMKMMPEGILGALAQGKGAKPVEEKLLALIEKSRRLGLEADKEAAMNKPMPTVADQVEHKTGLMDLQEMAKRLGVQITGIAPINAQPQAPQGAPQAPMPPAGIAAAPAPMPAPMPAQAAAPMPAHMAHGGVAHAVPHHMFRFSHGGGIMGFADGGTDKDKALAAIESAMPKEMPDTSTLNPSAYYMQRAAAIKAVMENLDTPAPYSGPRQETYAERDVRMHNQPALTSYHDPFSISNLLKKTATPEFKRSTLPFTDEDVAAAQMEKTSSNIPGEATKIVPVPNAPVPQAVGDALTKEQPKTPAGLKDALATQKKPAPEANPNKIVQSLMTGVPGTAPAAAPSEPAEKSQAQRIAEGYMTPPSVQAEIQKERDMAKAFGYDTPAGEDAMRRANAMEAKIAEFQQSHPMEKFQALLTGIQTGGYGGGAPAAAENERAYRENVLKQMEAIHNLKSPIEQARRAEAIAKGKNVTENMAKANETASRTATSLFGEEQRAKSAKELEQMRGLNALAVQQLSSATQIKIHQMAQAAADAHRELTAQEIEQSLKNDPKYKDMSYADRLNAAYGIKTGRSEKMGVAELSAIVKATAPIANTDEDAKAQMTWAMGELQKLYTGQNYQPGSAPSLEQFIAKAGPLNPKMTKDQLTAKYTELYGKK
jgi:hypothetical protein